MPTPEPEIAEGPSIPGYPIEKYVAEDDSGWSISLNTNGPWHYAYCTVNQCEEDRDHPKVAVGSKNQRLNVGHPHDLSISTWISGPGDGKRNYELDLYYGSRLMGQTTFPLKGLGMIGVRILTYGSEPDSVTCQVVMGPQGACTIDGVEYDCRPP